MTAEEMSRQVVSSLHKNGLALRRMNLSSYVNEYVCVVDGHLVGHGPGLKALVTRTRLHFPEHVPFVTFVPGREQY